AQAQGRVEHPAGGAQGTVRADGGGAAVPASPHPDPGLRRPHRRDQTAAALDDRGGGGRTFPHRLRRRDARRSPGHRSHVGLRAHAGHAGGAAGVSTSSVPARTHVHLDEEDEVTTEPAVPKLPAARTEDPAYFAAKAAEQASAENFPVALRMLPKTVREDLAVFYVFARYVDDLGDEYTGDRAAALGEVDADLGRLAAGGTPKLD